MVPLNFWEHQNAIKTLYSKCIENICIKHNITRMELDILLFLTNNPRFDTATEIIEMRYLSKSQVSASIKLLEGKGYIIKEYSKHNRKTAHLKICKAAEEIINDGKSAQEKFISIMLKGFSNDEINSMKLCAGRIRSNINSYLKEGTHNV